MATRGPWPRLKNVGVAKAQMLVTHPPRFEEAGSENRTGSASAQPLPACKPGQQPACSPRPSSREAGAVNCTGGGVGRVSSWVAACTTCTLFRGKSFHPGATRARRGDLPWDATGERTMRIRGVRHGLDSPSRHAGCFIPWGYEGWTPYRPRKSDGFTVCPLEQARGSQPRALSDRGRPASLAVYHRPLRRAGDRTGCPGHERRLQSTESFSAFRRILGAPDSRIGMKWPFPSVLLCQEGVKCY